jgi:pilus assembly protein Flp/PilA
MMLRITEIPKENCSMKRFNLLFSNFIVDESGQDLIEYALVASAVALIAVASMQSLSTAMSTVFQNITNALTNPTGTT